MEEEPRKPAKKHTVSIGAGVNEIRVAEKVKTMSRKEEPFTAGSGDIFKDFGFSDEEAAALTIKASLFRTLQRALKETPGTQTELAERLGVPQPKISDILNGKMSGFSVERVANYLLKLNYEICLDAHPAPEGSSGRVIDRSELLTL